jgi:uncharacterized protein
MLNGKLWEKMSSRVFFIPAARSESPHEVARKLRRLFLKADLGAVVSAHDLVALKIHFGETGNETSIPAAFVKPVAEEVKKRKGRPFWTDTCVLYHSIRDNAADHLQFAHDRGFTAENAGAPVMIADGLLGADEKAVPIPGKLFQEVFVASVARQANALIVISHVTGHMVTGLGGAIKNLGMGLASRKGKLRQHATLKPEVVKRVCIGCGACVENCPAGAIAISGDGKAQIDPAVCIGCGECLAVCRVGAIGHDWNRDSEELQRRMAEHALGVVIGRQNKIGYVNFIISVTKDCDCIPGRQKPILPDIGILAGTDPVALDAASLDLIEKKAGKSLTDLSYPKFDSRIQIRHAEAIGLGSPQYEWVEI